MELQTEVQSFANQMQHQLNCNAHKGDWREFNNPSHIMNELEYHKAKLWIAMRAGDKKAIKEYIADCANELLFLANTFEILDNEYETQSVELKDYPFVYKDKPKVINSRLSEKLDN